MLLTLKRCWQRDRDLLQVTIDLPTRHLLMTLPLQLQMDSMDGEAVDEQQMTAESTLMRRVS